MNKILYSIETLHHFYCEACKNWFSVSDLEETPQEITCCHCGVKSETEEFMSLEPEVAEF